MSAHGLRRFHENWSVYFTIGVVVWFLAAGFGVTDISLHRSSKTAATTASSSSDSADTSSSHNDKSITKSVTDNPYNPTVEAGPLKIKVAAFRLDTDKKHPGVITADVILQLKNTTKQNVNFSPSSVTLQRADGGGTVRPKEDVAIGVTPNIAMTAPLTFPVSPQTGDMWQLRYGGRLLYDGLPF